MTARLLRPFNINVAINQHINSGPISQNTICKDKTTTTETKNAIYMIPCRDCRQRYIGQTSKKIKTRITELKNAIKRHDIRSLLCLIDKHFPPNHKLHKIFNRNTL